MTQQIIWLQVEVQNLKTQLLGRQSVKECLQYPLFPDGRERNRHIQWMSFANLQKAPPK